MQLRRIYIFMITILTVTETFKFVKTQNKLLKHSSKVRYDLTKSPSFRWASIVNTMQLSRLLLLENNNPSLAPHSPDMTSLCSVNCCSTKPLLNSPISSCSLFISFWSESLSRTSWQIPVEISKRPEYCSASTVLLKRSSLAKLSVPFLFEQYKFLSRWRRRWTWLDFSL